MHTHQSVIEELQKQIRSRSGMLSLSTNAASNTLRKRSKKGIDLSELNHILEIRQEWAAVEPRVTFHQLCVETLKLGLLPPVVPEFTSITVGGAIMGGALESSSHRFGQVSDSCLEYEVILGNGEIVRAAPDENADLFYGLSGSYGTLGVLVKIKLRLIKAKKYVQLSYQSLKTKELLAFLTSPQEADFVEGIALNDDSGVAITGKMTSSATHSLFRQNRYWSPWYIQHIIENKSHECCMTIEEYLFRLDRGAFWMGQYVLSIPTMLRLLLHIGIPKLSRRALHPNLIFRLLFGWALNSRRLYRIWHHMPKQVSEKVFFVHDFYTPFSKVNEAFESFVAQTKIFPIWLCPIKGTNTPQILAPHFGRNHFLNIGMYGIPKSVLPTPELSAKLEKEITLFGGRKMLYSYTYYDRASFFKIYDEAYYAALRKKFFASEAFPHIYNKIIIC